MKFAFIRAEKAETLPIGNVSELCRALDVSPATDVPGGNPKRAGAIDLGMGAMIARGPTLNKKLTDLLAETATDEGIAHGFEVYSRTTQTDADEFHLARAGVPTGLLSVPTRYVHTPNELCDLAASRPHLPHRRAGAAGGAGPIPLGPGGNPGGIGAGGAGLALSRTKVIA